MKKIYAILNISILLAVLFVTLFQTVHSYEHFQEELAVKMCHHEESESKSELTHQHHVVAHCFECNFAFVHLVDTPIFSFNYTFVGFDKGYKYFQSREITQFFRGSLFSHRGPPEFFA